MNPAVSRFADLVKRCDATLSVSTNPEGNEVELSVNIPHSQWIDQKTATELAIGLAFFGMEADQQTAQDLEMELGPKPVVKDVLAVATFNTTSRKRILWGLIGVENNSTVTDIKHMYNPSGAPLKLDDLQVPQLESYDRITVKLGLAE